MKTSVLPDIKIASPCHANWGEMTGNDRNRFCASCQKNVYNLSAMTSKEASDLIRAKEGKLCVRYFLRRDGTILTQDCPVGLATIRKQILKIAAAFVSVLALVGFGCKKEESSSPLAGEATVTPQGQTVQPETRMGDVAVPPQTNQNWTTGMVAETPMMGSPVPEPQPQTNNVTEIKGEMVAPQPIMGKVAAPSH